MFKSKFRELSFPAHLLLKAIILSTGIYLLLAFLLYIDYLVGAITFRDYAEEMFNLNAFLLSFVIFLSVSILLFFLRLDQMLGSGNLLAYIKGTFHHPKEENRIFASRRCSFRGTFCTHTCSF